MSIEIILLDLIIVFNIVFIGSWSSILILFLEVSRRVEKEMFIKISLSLDF